MDEARLTPEQWDGLQFRMLIMYDAKVTWKGSAASFTGPDYTIWLIRKGRVAITPVSGNRIVARAGCWVLIPPGFRRHQQFTDNAEILSIHFMAGWPDGRHLFENHLPIVKLRELWPRLERAAVDLIACGGGRNTNPQRLFCEHARFESLSFALLEEWHKAVSREGVRIQTPRSLDARVHAVLQQLNQLQYTPIPYAELTEICGLSRVQLDRLFLQELGRTPHAYLEDRWRERVTEQLLTTSLPIKTICFDAGFRSLAHFSKWFRRQTGRSPRAYRQQYQVGSR